MDLCRSDPAMACAEVLDFSLVKGSKDNHTAIIVAFGESGSGDGFSVDPEYLPGMRSSRSYGDQLILSYPGIN